MAGSDWTCGLSAMWEWESPDYEPELPVSEKSNPLTRDIDRAPAHSIVRMLQACDAQMFVEERERTYQVQKINKQSMTFMLFIFKIKKSHKCLFKRLFSDQVVNTVMEVAKRVELILKYPKDSLVVLSGCGTSGRLAFLAASGFNRELRKLNHCSVYNYIIAGGDRALFSSQESPEDDPTLGMLSLKKVCEGKKHILFIGISCGLSAPFVAGQLNFCLQHLDIYTPVLLGFNPIHQAKNEPIPGCSFTFHSVIQRMQELIQSEKAFLINPAVGPEAISGSSRMKGGSATKILLDTILSAAHTAAFTSTSISQEGIVQHINACKKTVEVTYAQSDGIAALVEAAGQSLQCGRCVCYLGFGSLAVLGLIDASECNPTYGADYRDVRGFVKGGYRQLNINESHMKSVSGQFAIAHEDFLRDVLPHLTNQDTVLLLYTLCDDVIDVVELTRRVREKTTSIYAVYHLHTDGGTAAALRQQANIDELCLSSLRFSWSTPASESVARMQRELSTKMVLNAVSTGAHILKGKVYQNHMIDVQVTNRKLYHRATRLLQKLSGLPISECEESLLKAIYRVDKLTDDITSSDIIAHTHTARHRHTVVPLALLCLLTGCSPLEAESHLEKQPIIREAVEAWLS